MEHGASRHSQKTLQIKVADRRRNEQGAQQRVGGKYGETVWPEQVLRRQPQRPRGGGPHYTPLDFRVEPDQINANPCQVVRTAPWFGQSASHVNSDIVVVALQTDMLNAGNKDVPGFSRFFDPQGLFDDVQGHNRLALRIEQQREIVQRLGVIGFDLQRPQVARFGFAQPSQSLECVTQAVVRLGKIGFDLQRPKAARFGFAQSSQTQERVSKVVVRLGVIGVNLQRPPVARFGFVQPSQALKRVTQVVVRLGVIGFDLQRPPVARFGFVQPSHTLERVAQVVVRRSEIRFDLQRLSIARHRVINLPKVFQNEAQVAVNFGVTRQQCCSLSHGRQRVRTPVQLLEYRTQGLPTNTIMREAFGHRPCQLLGFNVTFLVEERYKNVDLLLTGPPGRGGFSRLPQRCNSRTGFKLIMATFLVFFPTAARAGAISFRFHIYLSCLRGRSQILVNTVSWQGRLNMLKLSAVPTGREILTSVPTDKSVGYFHLSLRDKTHIYKLGLLQRPLFVAQTFRFDGCGSLA